MRKENKKSNFDEQSLNCSFANFLFFRCYCFFFLGHFFSLKFYDWLESKRFHTNAFRRSLIYVRCLFVCLFGIKIIYHLQVMVFRPSADVYVLVVNNVFAIMTNSLLFASWIIVG